MVRQLLAFVLVDFVVEIANSTEMQSSWKFSPVKESCCTVMFVFYPGMPLVYKCSCVSFLQQTCVFPMIRRLRRVVLQRSRNSKTQACLKVSAYGNVLRQRKIEWRGAEDRMNEG